MANSRYTYVKQFETDPSLLPECWIVVRIDGRSFSAFTTCHQFTKPNDSHGLCLMTQAALAVMRQHGDIILSYGHSDEYSFVLKKSSHLFSRRRSKIESCIASLFASAFVFYWQEQFPSTPLQYPPSFDARAVVYPSDRSLRDYLSWRQVDCHINNQYNTCFWALVEKGGLTHLDAEKKLQGTLAADKNEILFSSFGINYNNELELFKKGTVIYRHETAKKIDPIPPPATGNDVDDDHQDTAAQRMKTVKTLEVTHEDIIGDGFWNSHSYLLQS